MKHLIILLLVSTFACTQAPEEQHDSNQTNEPVVEQTGVFFENIADGDSLNSPFLLKMGINGMEVEPKGEPREGYGHHHLLINDTYFDEGVFIAADSTHIHFGGGQVEDSVYLIPGEYVLTLQFGDGMHMSYGEAWSNSISVVVR
ncbi:MAG: DUF4399 domain-containing protein [Bacteroidia bacterium]